MDPTPRKAPRSRTANLTGGAGVSHEDIAHRQDMMALTMQRIELALKEGFDTSAREIAEIKKTVGWVGTDPHGALVGEGIAGDLGRLKARVDKRFGVYDGVTKYAAGATAAAVLALAVIWWLLESRLDEVLR